MDKTNRKSTSDSHKYITSTTGKNTLCLRRVTYERFHKLNESPETVKYPHLTEAETKET